MAIYRLPEQLDQLSDEQSSERHSVATSELDALNEVISFAEERRRSASAFQRRGYEELYRHGFGKTVVIDTENSGRQVLRTSLATCDYASTKLGYATPDSPIGRLCRQAQIGLRSESNQWGRYTIVEIRNFARFSGIEAAQNIKNFQVMESTSIADKGKQGLQTVINNLKLSLQRWYRPKHQQAVVTDVALSPLLENIPADGIEQESENWLDFATGQDYELFQDDAEEHLNHYDIYGRSDDDRDDYIGLSSYFFLNPTEEQLSVMAGATTTGPMLVEGVAGSGKTCVALGRAKTLCDLARTPDEEQFNADFLDESSVGFVRTGELVNYLKASCQSLSIDKLPIEEYRSLVYRLNNVRQLEQRSTSTSAEGQKVTRARYTNVSENLSYDFSAETTMNWLHASAQAIGALLQLELQKQLASLSIPAELLKAHFLAETKAGNALLELVKRSLASDYASLFNQLSGHSGGAFALDNLLSRLVNAHERIERDLFDKNTLWVHPSEEEWLIVKEAKAAVTTLREMSVVLVVVERVRDENDRIRRKATEILIETYTDLLNIFAQNGSVRSEDGLSVYVAEDAEIIWECRTDLKLVCDIPPVVNSIKITWAKDFDAVNIHLINQKLFGINQKRIFSLSESNPFVRKIEVGDEKTQTSLAARLRSQMQRIYSSWQYADLYRDALLSFPQYWQDYSHVSQASERLKAKLLADHDKDILLALAQIITRGAQSSRLAPRLQEQPFYPSVFIDEVQDFTEVQVFLMAQQADPKYHAVTLVGDMHQQLGRGNVRDLDACFPYHSLTKFLLKENKRQEREPQLAATSMLFRALVQNDSRVQESAGQLTLWREQAQNGTNKKFINQPFDNIDAELVDLISEQPHGRTIAVICPDLALARELEERVRNDLIQKSSRTPRVAEHIDLAQKYQVHFSCAENVKGLEFDTMIYVGLEKIDWANPQELNKVYVTISRPRKRLIMFGNQYDLPDTVATCLLTYSECRSA